MNTKNLFKTLAAAMLLPAMLLATACSSEDDTIVNYENTAEKGYTLPVTVNVTRQGDDATTRAAFNGDTKKLEFTSGDKLFVKGSQATAGSFAGTLDYASDGTFSGTVTTEKKYTGTIDALFAEDAKALLLPAEYGSYGFLGIYDRGTSEVYDDLVICYLENALASDKKTAIEQFSYEFADSYSSGFALAPAHAILSFTITGLAASTEVAVAFSYSGVDVSKSVTTDASGTATFAIGVEDGTELKDCTLTVGGNAITLVSSSKEVAAGKIYNITRSVAAAGPTAYTLAESTVGMIVGTDGKAYDVADKDNLPTGVTAVGMVAYKSGSNGLAIQLNSSPVSESWADAKTYAEGLNTSTPIAGCTWRLPSKEDWQNMFLGCAVSGDASSASDNMTPIAGFKEKIAATGITWQSGTYWSSTSSGDGWRAWDVNVTLNGSDPYANFGQNASAFSYSVLGCLAF